MTRGTVLLAWCVLMLPNAVTAQSPSAAADPVSGTWTGYMGRNESERQPITVELQLDGRAVRGTITGPPHPGDIRTGTFDASTGILKFEVVVGDEAKTVVNFEGKLAQAAIAGSVSFDSRKGVFSITKKVAGAGAAVAPGSRKQPPGKRTPEQIEASYEAHKGDFDYLLGDWEFTAESKEYGKFRGYWSAVRLSEGQILDEYRVVGDNGETYYVTTSLRNYNKALDRWELIGADAGTGLQDFGTGRRVGADMHIEQKFGVTSDQPSVWRIRYYNIQANRFSWTADRSIDGGKTWVKNHQQIEAHRIGPPRSLAPLAPAKATRAR